MEADRQPDKPDRGLFDLLLRARSGDAIAQSEFFDKTFRRLRIAVKRLGVREDTEDYAQIALAELFDPGCTFKEGSDSGVFSYLVTIAMNHFRDRKKKEKRLTRAPRVQGGRMSVLHTSESDLEQVLGAAVRNLDPKLTGTLALLLEHKQVIRVAELLAIDESTVRWRRDKAFKQIAAHVHVCRPEYDHVLRGYFGSQESDDHE